MTDDLNGKIADMGISFLASFPPIQSAIKITGNGDGMRIQLDIPETEMANSIELLALRGRVVLVTIEKQKEPENERNSQAKRTKSPF